MLCDILISGYMGETRWWILTADKKCFPRSLLIRQTCRIAVLLLNIKEIPRNCCLPSVFVCIPKELHFSTFKYAFSSNIAQFSKKDGLLHPFLLFFVSESKNEVVNIPSRYVFHASISRTVTSCGLLSNI